MKQYNSVFIDPRSHVNIRKYRPDHMSHYPFADDKGAVEDVLRTDHSGNLQGLMDMGPPAQKRFLDKTFDEVKVSKDGMRLVDVCEALQVSSYNSIVMAHALHLPLLYITLYVTIVMHMLFTYRTSPSMSPATWLLCNDSLQGGPGEHQS